MKFIPLISVLFSGFYWCSNKRSASPSCFSPNQLHNLIDLFNKIRHFVISVLFATVIKHKLSATKGIVILKIAPILVSFIKPFCWPFSRTLIPVTCHN